MKSFVLGVGIAGIAVAASGFTVKETRSKSLAGEIYVNVSPSADQYQLLSAPYDDTNCQSQSGMTCSYVRTNFEPEHNLPASFTEEEAQEFVEAGWLEANSAQEGIYTP